MSCGAVQVPLTEGVVRVVGAREAGALDGAALAHICTSTRSWREYKYFVDPVREIQVTGTANVTNTGQ